MHAEDIERELRARGTPEGAAQEKRYLKSSLQHVGATVPAMHAVTRAFRAAHPDLTRSDLVSLVDDLWTRGVFECRMAAVDLLELYSDRLRQKDASLIERLVRDSHTWALVDGLAASVLGPLVERFPALEKTMLRWGKDPDFWVRRSALLSQLLALRGGRTTLVLFGRIADPLLEENEFFIRKAIGWVLRDASRRDPASVYAWLVPRAHRASGLTLREATKHLDPKKRAAVLAAARKRGQATFSPTTFGVSSAKK